MAQPNPLNTVLTQYLAGHVGDQEFHARHMAPAVKVAGKRFSYYKYGAGLRRNDSDQDLAPADAASNRVDIHPTLVTDEILTHKLHDFFDEDERTAARMDGQEESTRLAKTAGIANLLMLAEEIRLATLIENTGNVPNGAATAAFGAGSDDPIGDVEDAIEHLRDTFGRRATRVWMPSGVWRDWVATSEVQDLLKYKSGPRMEVLAQHFLVKEFVVLGAAKDSAAEGQTESLGGIWSSTKMWVTYEGESETADRFDPRPLKTFVRTDEGRNGDGVRVKIEAKTDPDGEKIIVYRDYLTKVVNTATIYMLTGC